MVLVEGGSRVEVENRSRKQLIMLKGKFDKSRRLNVKINNHFIKFGDNIKYLVVTLNEEFKLDDHI